MLLEAGVIPDELVSAGEVGPALRHSHSNVPRM